MGDFDSHVDWPKKMMSQPLISIAWGQCTNDKKTTWAEYGPT